MAKLCYRAMWCYWELYVSERCNALFILFIYPVVLLFLVWIVNNRVSPVCLSWCCAWDDRDVIITTSQRSRVHPVKDFEDICDILVRTTGVRNPMKMSDIGFLKTEPKRPQNSKAENSVSAVQFSKKRLRRFWGRFFTLSHSQFILWHDRINSQSIFLHAVSLHF